VSYNHLKPLGELGQIVPVRIDVRDKASLERAVSRSNVVINLIGRQWETRNFSYDDVNHKAAKAIAEVSQHVDRFIHVSASGVSTNSDNKWSRSKAEGEEAVKSLLPWATIMKPTVMFGDEDRLLNKFGIIAQYWPVIPLVAKGAFVQPLEGTDLGRAIVAALGSARSIGKTYVLGGPEKYTWEKLIHRILAGTKREKPLYEVSVKTMAKIANIIQHAAIEPLYIPEEVNHQAQDLVVDAKDNTIIHLGIKPTPIDSLLHRVSRAYRHPMLQSDMIDSTPPVTRY